MRSPKLFDFTMHRFAAELVFDLLNKSQAANGNCFRPASISMRQIVLQRLLDPLSLCPLQIRQFHKGFMSSASWISARPNASRLDDSKSSDKPFTSLFHEIEYSYREITPARAGNRMKITPP